MQQSKNLYKEFRSRLALQGITIKDFCEENGFKRQTVYKAMNFERNGQKAQEIRNCFLETLTAQAANR